jgi:transposase
MRSRRRCSATQRRAWRLPPADWRVWQSVNYYLRKWRRDGTLERIYTVLHDELRIALHRDS